VRETSLSTMERPYGRVVWTMLALSAVARLDAQVVKGCADTKYPLELPAPSAFVDSVHAINDLAAFAAPSKPMVLASSSTRAIRSPTFVRSTSATRPPPSRSRTTCAVSRRGSCGRSA